MTRDRQKQAAYFGDQIDFSDAAAEKRFLDTENFPNIAGRPGRAHDLASYTLQNVILRYSRGDAINSLHSAVWRWIDAKEKQQRVHANLPSDLANIRQIYEKLRKL